MDVKKLYSEPCRRPPSKTELFVKKKFDSYPCFQRSPNVIGHFCIDANRSYLPNAKLLKYLFYKKDADVNFDLNEGLSKHVAKNEEHNEKLDHIFHWLRQNKYRPTLDLLKTDFVCFRGMLTKIMYTPYEEHEPWIICAQRINKTIFLCDFETEHKKKKKREELNSVRLKQCTAWGYKFEQYMLSAKPGVKPNTSEPVIANEEMCCMFKSKLNTGHRVIYAAEMDGIMNDEPIDPDKDRQCLNKSAFVELKTNRNIENSWQDSKFRKNKFLKWWCQSYLVGIKTIICGFRNDDGIIQSLKQYRVKDLPKMSKGIWNPWVCINFCGEFLDFVVSSLDKTESNTLWTFTWSPGNSVKGEEINYSSEYDFIPEWFVSKKDELG